MGEHTVSIFAVWCLFLWEDCWLSSPLRLAFFKAKFFLRKFSRSSVQKCTYKKINHHFKYVLKYFLFLKVSLKFVSAVLQISFMVHLFVVWIEVELLFELVPWPFSIERSLSMSKHMFLKKKKKLPATKTIPTYNLLNLDILHYLKSSQRKLKPFWLGFAMQGKF